MDTFEQPATPLYPPHIEPATAELPIWSLLRLLVANPMRIVPEQVYREPIVTAHRLGLEIAWITDPALIMTVLLGEAETYEKSDFEKRILGPNVANGILGAIVWAWRNKGAPMLRCHRHAAPLAPKIPLATFGPRMRFSNSDFS